jgi:hypothetical protein
MTSREVGARLRALKVALGKCFLCDELFHEDDLEFAHVEPTGLCGRGRGIQGRFFDILKYPRSYVLACRPCHKRADGFPWARESMFAPERLAAYAIAFDAARQQVYPKRADAA